MQLQHGSGKTAVLVERIIHKIIDENIDIDKLLVVTFTNAAASEMRQRVLEAIYQKLEDEPDNKNLQRQIVLLAKSNICTIHSFCLDVIKNNFYELDISPNFKIGEETELEILKQEVIEEIFERKYDIQDENFLKLLNTYTDYKKDDDLKEIILKIYKYIQSMPFPLKWLNEKVEEFNVNEINDFSETIWGKLLLEEIKEQIEVCFNLLKAAKEQLSGQKELERWYQMILIDFNQVQECVGLRTWDEFYEKVNKIGFDRWITDKKVVSQIKDEAKEKRDTVKDIIGGLKENFLIYASSQEVDNMKHMYEILKTLELLIIEFMEEYATRKKEKNIIDFNDIEHFALNILVKENEKGKIVPTYVAKKYQEKFIEIAIDEYQDSNLVQEYILSTISNKDNMFMVGDVKQSIYKFRQACPELFLEKYEKYKLKDEKKDKDSLKIQLFKNFRSRENVLGFTNLIFQDIMSKRLGDIEYNKDEYLNVGASYPKPENCKDVQTQIEIIDMKEPIKERNDENEEADESDEEIIEKAQLEARFVANRIKQLLDNNMMVWNNKKQEYIKATYKDIVILLRSTSLVAPIYEKEISDLGMPVFSDVSSGYLDTLEIQVVMSLLKIIDNTMQDIPLVTVLRSMIGGFNENELIQIRMIDKDINFYEAMIKYIESEEAEENLKQKIICFLEKIDKWREKAEYNSLDELIWQIYKESGYYSYVSLMQNGNLKIANLKLLFEKAKQYEKSSFKGLFNFIQFIEKLKSSNGDFGSAKLIGENENVIRIMSIHKSKGLEFPIVFLAGTGKMFNMQDLNENILLHQELGIGPEFRDEEDDVRSKTNIKQAIRLKMKEETLSEEMRILYVALTRAKEKLVITGVSKDLEKELNKKQDLLKNSKNEKENKIKPSIIKKGKSYLDWIEMVYLNNIENNKDIFSFNSVTKQEILKDKEKEETIKEVNLLERLKKESCKEKLDKKILEKLNWSYPYKLSFEIPTKSSVTKIKQMQEKEEFNYERVNLQKPKFLEEQISIDGAKKGTLIHLCMQRLDNTKGYKKEDIVQMVEDMQKSYIITQQEAEAIEIEKVYNFTKSKIWQELKNAKKVYKEKPFYISIPAKEIYREDANENILVQGIIDLYYINEKDEVVLVDYKTDYVKEIDETKLVEKYKKQLEIYKRALEEATNKKVNKVYIYSTYLNKEISVK